ncbi:MAG: glycoside hydrolase [Acidobacteriia bacterium]|nr:glycoside hydrolase [Terriglobia bacterium]
MKFESGNLWYEVSADGGDTFGHAVRMNDVDGEVVSHAEATPRLYLRGGRPFALWQAQAANDRGSMKLRFARSMDYGKSFEKAIDVDPTGPASQSFFNLGVSPQGTIYVVWLDGRDRNAGHGGHSEHGGSAIYLARSTDGGASFGPSIRVATNSCPCCRPSIAFTDDNTVHVGFRKVFDGNVRDLAVVTSSDGGKSWANPVRVAQDNWQINGCPHSGPSLAALGNRLFVSWFTIHEGEQQSYIFLAHSDDRGRTFSPSVSLSEGTVDPNHPFLIAASDRLFAVFQARERDTNRGWGRARVYLREVSAAGRLSHLTSVPNLSASASYPTVAFESPDKLFLAWTESVDAASNIVVTRGRLIGAGM